MAEPVALEVFTDYVCPWCYLSTPRLDRLERKFDIRIRLVFFPLHPDTPREGRALEDLFPGRVEAMHERMRGLMDQEGLPYNRRTHTYNSRLAQELGKWADTEPRGGAIHDALYRAYFVEGRNIGDPDVLVAVAESVGLPGGPARKVIQERSFKDAVAADWVQARRSGVSAVPTFAAGVHRAVGAQPYEMLEHLLEQAGAVER